MKLTAGQAAKQTGKSVPTIVRAYTKGQLSGEKLPDGGGYLFDASEVFRVFPPVTSPLDNTDTLGHETPNSDGALQAEVRFLRERLDAQQADRERERALLSDQVKMVSSQLSDARQDRDHWREQAERITRQLAPPAEKSIPAPPVAPERPSLVAWLIGAIKR